MKRIQKSHKQRELIFLNVAKFQYFGTTLPYLIVHVYVYKEIINIVQGLLATYPNRILYLSIYCQRMLEYNFTKPQL